MMKIDLCKIFGVEEGEEFKVDAYVIWFSNFKYKIRDNVLLRSKLRENDFTVCGLSLNELKYIKEIIRFPKKKNFTDDELCILRNIDKKYKWIAKDKDGEVCIYINKPKKEDVSWDNFSFYKPLDIIKDSLFTEIKWEDEEPIYIDDYVER